MSISAALFLGFVLGCLCMLLFITLVLRWGFKHKNMLSGLVKEIYHIDLLPFICRIEGLLSLIIMEWTGNRAMMIVYAELALKEVKQLKNQVITATKKYEHFQN